MKSKNTTKSIEMNIRVTKLVILIFALLVSLMGCSQDKTLSLYYSKNDLEGRILGYIRINSTVVSDSLIIDSIFEYRKDLTIKKFRVNKYKIKNDTLFKYIENCGDESYYVPLRSITENSCITYHQQCLTSDSFTINYCYLGFKIIKISDHEIKSHHFTRYEGEPTRMIVDQYFDSDFHLLKEVFDEGSDEYYLPGYTIERLEVSFIK